MCGTGLSKTFHITVLCKHLSTTQGHQPTYRELKPYVLLDENVAGSFSRTAVNFSAGCQTAVSNIIMAITVIISLELLTRLLYFTPVAILASIILAALPGLIDISEACKIWRVDKVDFIICLGAFLGVLFASVETGLLTAVWFLTSLGLSLFLDCTNYISVQYE